jgi:hypothetical protein
MPPRYAYWTILIDEKPTAFRAREREELLPTFHQLRRKNPAVAMKWFARGRLWESPEAAEAVQRAPKPPREKRGRDWRPGGAHRDPRDRFKKRSQAQGRPPESARPVKAVSPRGPQSFSRHGTATPRKPWRRDQAVERFHGGTPAKRQPDAPSSAAEPSVSKTKRPEKN